MLLGAISIAASLAGCGHRSADPSSTTGPEQAVVQDWDAYTPAAQEQYRQAFRLCAYWVTTGNIQWTVGPTEAADFFIAHDLFTTPLGAGCGDGIANTPLAGSGLPAQP